MISLSLKILVYTTLAIQVVAGDDDENEIIFQLHTNRSNPLSFDIISSEISIRSSNWNSSHPTRMYIHGFRGPSDSLDQFAKAILGAGDYNMIVVNWLRGATTINYPLAVSRTQKVADELAAVIKHLQRNGLDLSRLLIVGHSLGAHIAGMAGKKMYGDRKIGIIIGLDPASPLFSSTDPKSRLARTDARYVQVIHTNGGVYGMEQPIGHADFYVNGGKQQPGCVIANLVIMFDGCNHKRAREYYLESLISGMTYISLQCASYEEIREGECTAIHANRTVLMGGNLGDASDKPRGIFYLETNMWSPFVIRDVKYSTEIRVIRD